MVMAVMIILGNAAAPSFRLYISNSSMNSGISDFVGAMQLSKAESISRIEAVTLCKKNTNDNGCVSTGDWSQGWISFIDSNRNGTVENGEEILSVRSALGADITFKGTLAVADFISYFPSGISSIIGAQTLVMCDSRGFGEAAKAVLVTITGNASVMTASESNQTTCL